MDVSWVSDWGSWISLGSLIVSLVGLVVVFLQARRAKIASLGAERAAAQTSKRIALYLQTVSLERAIASVQRVKLLHRFGQWEASLEQYQTLRSLIIEIISRSHPESARNRSILVNDQALLRSVEREVTEQVNQHNQPILSTNFHHAVDQIQSDLEDLVGGNDSVDVPRE